MDSSPAVRHRASPPALYWEVHLPPPQGHRAAPTEGGREPDVLGIVAHELRNCLGASTTALAVARAGDPDASRHALEVLERQLHGMERIVADLLDAARIRAGKLDVNLQPLMLAEAIGDAINTGTGALAGRQQRITWSCQAGLQVCGDRQRIVQALVNLLLNASRHGRAGGLVDVTAFAHRHWAVVEVSDDGTGMDSATLRRLFELYAQGEGSKDGLGVGLHLVRVIAAMHGGRVSAHSAGLGCGSMFRIMLPRLDPAAN